MSTLSLVQPSVRRRWELREGDEVRGVLWLPAVRSRARAVASGRSLTIEQRGWPLSEYVVRDGSTGDVVARVREGLKQTVLELGGTTAEWTQLGKTTGQLASMAEFGFVSGGEPLLTARISDRGIIRLHGEITLAPALAETDALVLALLAACLLIRGNERALGMKVLRS